MFIIYTTCYNCVTAVKHVRRNVACSAYVLSEVNAGLCVSPAGLPRLRETHDSSGTDIVEKFQWPSSPPQSPLASDDEDFEISENVKENVTSDSSTDEGLMTPLTPQTDTANNLHPPEQCHNSTNTERWVRSWKVAVIK